MPREPKPSRGEHEKVWEVLPWYVNRSLPDDELRWIERHVGDCDRCQAEVQMLGELAHHLGREPIERGTGAAALELVRSRIEGSASRAREADPVPPDRPNAPARRGRGRLLAWAVAAQLGILVGLGAYYVGSDGEAPEASRFRTFSTSAPVAPGPDSPTVRLVFDPQTTEAEIRGVLQESRARIVDGPSPFGVYTVAPLAVGQAQADELLAALRSRSEVRFAEPVLLEREPPR